MTSIKIPEMLTLSELSRRSGLSYDYLRNLCIQNKITHIRCGRKYLVNADRFIDFLNGDTGDNN